MKIHRHIFEELAYTLEVVFEEGIRADKVIEKTFKSHKQWGARDRRFFAETLYECVRHFRWYECLVGERDYRRVIALFVHEKNPNETPDWPEFDFDFNEIKNRKGRFEKIGAIKESYPDWLYDLGSKRFGAEWPALAKALNAPAEVYLRANTLKSTPKAVIEALKEDNIDARILTEHLPKEAEKHAARLPSALRLPQRKNVFPSKAFQGGLIEVQDAASQIVSQLLDPQPGERVFDACAGGGGKTLHMAALMKNKGRIISMDIHGWKLEELKKRARRNGVSIVETRVIESTKTIKRLADQADRVLLDVPCSGLGVIRRNPDAKWKVSPEEIERLIVLQSEILTSYSRMARPGGKLVYATCSILPEENEMQVEKFLKENPGKWKLIEELHLRPDKEGFDGFYAALMEKVPTN